MSDYEQRIQFLYELPTDHDGFVRRQCSTCERQFKWYSGSANEEAEQQPDAEVYYCPLCGAAAEPDDWLTFEQKELLEVEARRAATPVLDEMIGSFLNDLKGPNITVKRTNHLEAPDAADPLVETDDMAIVLSPCHGYEPIKVPDDWAEPLYCLVCGQRFAV